MHTDLKDWKLKGRLDNIENESFDLIVIGGGITGAGIALDAQLRGMKVCLLEMQDFAGGTSSRSTKLIHGGLRYLKQLNFKLVAQTGQERSLVAKIAPHVTHLQEVVLPIYKNGSLGKFGTKIALIAFEFLAEVDKSAKHTFQTKKELETIFPKINSQELQGAFTYSEYRTDDARLTLEVILSAEEAGAKIFNYCMVNEILTNENNKVCGVEFHDRLLNKTITIKGKNIINAAGPWVDKVEKLIANKTHKSKLFLTKGIHLVIDQKRLPISKAIYFDTFDKRMIFIVPRGNYCYIGTTDTEYKEELLHPSITKMDVEYIIKNINILFPSHQITINDVVSSWSGVRPLILEEGKSPSEISRKDEIFKSEENLYSIAGGKLTGYRLMAIKILDKLIKDEALVNLRKCTTDVYPLIGAVINGKKGLDQYLESKKAEQSEYFDKKQIELLILRHGKKYDKIQEIVSSKNEFFESYNACKAEISSLYYAMKFEHCRTPLDFFMRRTSYLLFDIHKYLELKEVVIEMMASYYSWNDDIRKQHTHELKKVYDQITLSSLKS